MAQKIIMLIDDASFFEELKEPPCLNGCEVFIPEDIRSAAMGAERIKADAILLDMKMAEKDGF